jgi:hypothetical protein
VWVAERLEALVTDELLGSGTQRGRDYQILWLEDYWRNKRSRFEKISLNIADRRGNASIDVDVGSLAPLLEASLDATEWTGRYAEIMPALERRVRREAADQMKVHEWLRLEELESGTIRERAVSWRTLEILVQRERNEGTAGI